MSSLELMPWDTRVLGARVARVPDVTRMPSAAEMDAFDLVIARLPMEWDEGRERYQDAGFDFVTLDVNMFARPAAASKQSDCAVPMIWISKIPPPFAIEGFQIEDSRLMRDSRCRERLPRGFWDKVIAEHCSSYSDRVACALTPDRKRLVGVVSCFERHDSLDLFLVAVEPESQSLGIGKNLMDFVGHTALNEGFSLKTQVLATNIRAMNFYLKQRFLLGSGELVMHRWTEKIAR